MRIRDWSSGVCSSDLSTVRTARKWLEQAGAPLCPIEDNGQMSQSRWTTTERMRARRGNKRAKQMYIPSHYKPCYSETNLPAGREQIDIGRRKRREWRRVGKEGVSK